MEEKVGGALSIVAGETTSCIPVAQALITTINEWDLMRLRHLCRAKDTSIILSGILQKWKRLSPIPHPTEGSYPK